MNITEVFHRNIFFSLPPLFRPRPIVRETPTNFNQEISENIAKISLISRQMHSLIRQTGNQPHGDMWAELNFTTADGGSCWFQASNGENQALILNIVQNEQRNSLRLCLSNITEPVQCFETRNIHTNNLVGDENISCPNSYSRNSLIGVRTILQEHCPSNSY